MSTEKSNTIENALPLIKNQVALGRTDAKLTAAQIPWDINEKAVEYLKATIEDVNNYNQLAIRCKNCGLIFSSLLMYDNCPNCGNIDLTSDIFSKTINKD